VANIRKRGKKYQARVRIKGENISRNFTSKRDAQEWSREMESNIDRGRTTASKETISSVIDRYLSEKEHPKNKATMLEWYRQHMGNKKLADVRKADFVKARDEVKKLTNKRYGTPFSVATVNRYSMAMASVLTVAVEEWFLLETNPARIKQIREDNKRDRVLTDAEQERLITALEECEEIAILPMALIAMGSGARAGELTNLRWNDVDLNQGIAILRDTKNGDSRAIPIRGYALDMLKAYRTSWSAVPLGSAFVFKNLSGRAPFFYYRAWDEARTKAGIPDFKFHDLRHTAASLLAMSGRSLGEVGALLGHRSVQTTKRYSHYASQHVLEMGEALEVRKKH